MRSKIKWKLKNLPINKTMGKSDGRNRSPRPIWRPEFKDWSCNLKIRYNENPAALTFKECVIVEFPNCISTTTNKPFQWMPRSIEQKIIVNGLAEVDRADMEKWIKCLLKATNYLGEV